MIEYTVSAIKNKRKSKTPVGDMTLAADPCDSCLRIYKI